MVIDYQQLVCNYRAKEFFFSNSFNIPLSKLNIYKKKKSKVNEKFYLLPFCLQKRFYKIPLYRLRAHFEDITQSTSLTKPLGGAATRYQT